MKQIKLLFIIFLFAGCTGRTYRVTNESMSGTLTNGQVLELSKKTLINRGDIVFFRTDKNPKKQVETWLFRVIALSGDTLEIKNGNVMINGSFEELPEKARLLYSLYAKSSFTIKDFQENTIKLIGGDRYIANLTKGEYSEISKMQNINSIERIIRSAGELSKNIVRNSGNDIWNEDQFGPLLIPSPGAKIKINPINMGLYSDILSQMEPDSTIMVKEKLYFLMGDNRYNAFDSRFIGLVTEANIIGVLK